VEDVLLFMPQELLAYGIANVTCSMLNCYVSTASLSRSLVQESSGGKTQVMNFHNSKFIDNAIHSIIDEHFQTANVCQSKFNVHLNHDFTG